jgi:hypothetical protein
MMGGRKYWSLVLLKGSRPRCGVETIARRLDPDQETHQTGTRDAGQVLAVGSINHPLADFGFPRAHEDDAERAVRAGLEVIGSSVGLPGPQSPSRSE